MDSFNAPYYAPSIDELVSEIQREGSFLIDRLETFKCEWNCGLQDVSGASRGERVGRMMRAAVESIVECHFGGHIMDQLFRRYVELVEDWYSKRKETENLYVAVSLIRKD